MSMFQQKPFIGYNGKLVIDPETLAFWSRWEPASGHPKGWRVTRGVSPLQEAEDKAGRRRLFKSREAAQRVANKLNQMEAKP